jgi:hypothetical protein
VGNRSTDAVPNHGSVFFIKPRNIPFAVTARHVYEGYVKRLEQNSGVKCQINSLRFDPTQRLVGYGRDCDIATFWLTPTEFEGLDRLAIPWPPLILMEGQLVLYAGLPAVAKKSPEPGYVDFGVYTSLAVVDSLSDRDISSVTPPPDQLIGILGKGLPPQGYDLAGMSGGPMIILVESHAGIVSWWLAGIIYECHPTFEIVKGARADAIHEDGTVLCEAQ